MITEGASSVESGVMVQPVDTMVESSSAYESISISMTTSSNNAETSSSSSIQPSPAPVSCSIQAAPSDGAMTWYNQAQNTTSGQLSQRPVQDIVSSVQGSYNFLQESEIDGPFSVIFQVFISFYFEDIFMTMDCARI